MPEQSSKTLMVMAGGTGGHVFPGIAIAEAMQMEGFRIVWLGTQAGIEADLVPKHGFNLRTIHVAGVRGKGIGRLLLAPVMVLRAVWEALAIVRQEKPGCVLGMGGFAAGPGGIAAWLLRKPLVIHEQNAVPGTTNKILARFASKILTGFPGVFSGSGKELYVGNPVRQSILALEEPKTRGLGEHRPLRMLVLGGSLGARAVNGLVAEALSLLPASDRPEVRHQAGRSHAVALQQNYHELGVEADVIPFIDRMDEAYAWADFVICRAGALTVAEVAAAGLPAVFFPLPIAIDDHQRKNAQWLSGQGGAEVLNEKEISARELADKIGAMMADPARLKEMAVNSWSVAKRDATEQAVSVCRELAHA